MIEQMRKHRFSLMIAIVVIAIVLLVFIGVMVYLANVVKQLNETILTLQAENSNHLA